MANEIENYARFYGLLNRLPGADKDTLVYQFSYGRTTHLRLLTKGEYKLMCNEMERVAGISERKKALVQERKRKRSLALHLMQQWGVDTANWDRVNAFCENPRIAGKDFRALDMADLEKLILKLRVMVSRKVAEKRTEK